MNYRKFFQLVAIISFVVLLAQSGAQAATWKLSHMRTEGSEVDIDTKWFAAEAKKATNGRVNIDIYPSSVLGDYSVVQERISIGDIEMMLACINSTVDRMAMLPVFPFITKDWKEAKIAYGRGGVIYRQMEKLFDRQNIHMLTVWPAYFGGIILRKDAKGLKDPTVKKNLKLRTPFDVAYSLVIESQGFMATPIALSDTFSAMQTGIVDGAIGAGAEGYYSNFRDLAKVYLPINDHFECWFFIVNKDIWNGLSKEDRDKLTKLANKLHDRRWAEAPKAQAMHEKNLESAGIKVVRYTDKEMNKIQEQVKKNVWPALYKENHIVSEKIVKEVLDSLKK